MTIAEMRALLGLPAGTTDDAVVQAYGAYLAAMSAPPVALEAVKRQLVVTSDDDDQLIMDLTAAAVGHVEDETGLVLSQRQVVEAVDSIARPARLRAWPITSIDAVTFHDAQGVLQTYAATSYAASISARPGRVFALGTLPRCSSRPNEIIVTMTAGYTDVAQVPAVVIQAIMVLIAEFYRNREAGSISDEAQRSLNWLLRRHKVKSL